jgi:predicted MPP superfamily phosphohydrolase
MYHGSFVPIFLIIISVSLLLDWYVFAGLKTLTKNCKNDRRRYVISWLYLAVSVGITVYFIAGFENLGYATGMLPYHEWVLSIFVTVLITKVFFVLMMFLGDTGRFLYGLVNNLVKPKGKVIKPFFPARRKFISQIALGVAALPFTGLFYGMLKGKYDFKLHRQTLYFDNLPDAFDGFTITQVSDIHSGSFDNDAAVQRGIDLAKAQKSDLFVFTGDLVNNVAKEIEPYLDRFSQLKAPYGQFSILGNHDYGDYIMWPSEEAKNANLDKLKEHHKTLGYRLLIDENVELEKDGQKISLLGVQNWGRGFRQAGDLDKAMKGVDKDAFKILLSHDPTHWEEKVRYNPTTIDLTLAGHTHGAQFGVEIPGFRWSPVQYRYFDWAGLANEKNRYLYVNRGFGFLAFSGRLGIWPEITVITLKKTV